jgi:hypothetical protein
MLNINRNFYQVYYMDNDRQKRIIRRGLSYQAAVKLCQEMYTDGLECDYEMVYQGLWR